MASESKGKSFGNRSENVRAAVDPLVTEPASGTASGRSKMELVSKALFAPFSHKKADSTRILSDRKSTPCTPSSNNPNFAFQLHP